MMGLLKNIVCETPGLTVGQAAKRLGVGRVALSRVLNGKARLSVDLAARIEKEFGFAAYFLLEDQLRKELDAALAKVFDDAK